MPENFEKKVKDDGNKTKVETSKPEKEEKHEGVVEDPISGDEVPMSHNMVKVPVLKKK